MHEKIPDFNDTELWTVHQAVAERFREPVEVQQSVCDQYGTGKHEYDNIGDCVMTLLQVQADHDAKRRTEESK